MNKSRYRILTLILAAAASVCMLTACNEIGEDRYWEDTLPLPAARTTADIVVITEDTLPPISISVPATTTVAPVTKDTELATTTTTAAPPTVATSATSTAASSETEAPISTVSGVPTVILPEFTSTTTTGVAVTKVTTSKPETEHEKSENTAQVTELTGDTLTADESEQIIANNITTTSTDTLVNVENLTLEAENSNDGDSPFTFRNPITSPYFYTTLEGDMKQAYELIVKAIKNHDSKVKFPDYVKITSDDYAKIYQMIYDSEHTVYHIDTQMKYTTNIKTGYIVSAELCYIYTADEVNTMQKKIDEAADKIIDGITSQMSEYDIVKYFYDSLVKSCVYDLEADNCRDLYGCLVNGRAVCGGYAKAFSYLCDKVGISSLTITGDFEEIPHMWNMVRIGGQWYHIDVTSGYVTNAETQYIRYDYFCVNDVISERTHKPYEQDYKYPAATENKYNYYVYNNLVANTVDEAINLISTGILTASRTGERVIQIACASDEVFEDTVYSLFDKSQAKALTIYEDMYSAAEKKYKRESIVYNQEKDTRVIKLFIDYVD